IHGVGYQCNDFESFTAGKCDQCGPNGDKCAVIGENAKLSQKYEKTTQNTRFFLSTTGKTPFFKYEFEIRVRLPEETPDSSDNHGILMVTLHGDNDEQITLNEKDQIFHLGQTYTFIAKFDYKFGDVKKVTFKWHRTLGGIIKQKMWIDSITVVPLSSDHILDTQAHLKEIKTFCTVNRGEAIQNEKDVDFDVICK
ncbi:unnamed protein product, partial [Medioppia subpectinata]